ncbi:MAG: MBL fold metallo-hydrolase [Thermoguttaceae bacterium]|jgi:glyoxylase-like metal-dependent hydrolase (beta-lactamase superfamily II)
MLIDNPPVEVADGLWMLGTTPYPVYLARGRREGAIIEGGISALGPILRRQLAELGAGPDFVRQAVVTHAHPDHVMAIPLLRELFPGITVVASDRAAATLGVEKAISFFRQIDAALTGALSKSGVLADEPPPPLLRENRIAVDRVVREGDQIAVEDTAWTVLETPGHSDCSIALHDSTRRMLVISDASGYYMPASETWWPGYFTDYAAYLRSVQRLAGLEAEILCLSHNGAIRGGEAVRSYFARAIAATRQYHDRIVTEARSGKPSRQIAEELGAEIHRQTPLLPLDFFQKNCGLLVKQSLKHEGISAEKK